MEMTVKDVMTLKVMTLKMDEQLSLADDVMHLSRIRHLPVLDGSGERLVGIVSQRDLFRGALAQAVGYTQRARRKLLSKLKIKDVMSADVVTTTPDTPLEQAARMLIERKIGCLPVVGADGRLAGILTEADFVALYANHPTSDGSDLLREQKR
jgi:CBS domain-containing membrane protein